MTNVTYSTKPTTNIATSTQKRRTLYLSESDPRVTSSDTVSKYQNDYYAEIVILSDAQYANLIAKQVGVTVNADGTTNVILDDTLPSESVIDASATVSTLHPPTNLYWDYSGDPGATNFNENNGSVTVDIVITFDPSVDDILTDGTVMYDVQALSVNSSSTSAAATTPGTITSSGSTSSGSTSSSSVKFANVTGITKITATSSSIELRWKYISNALSYSVSATGNNMELTSSGQKSRIYTSLNGNSNGYHYWTLTPLSGKSFSGQYTFSVKANYTNGQSATGDNISVTI